MNRALYVMFVLIGLVSCAPTAAANSIVIGSLREGILLESFKIYAMDETGAHLSISVPFSDAYDAMWSADHQWITYQTQDTASRTDPQVFVTKADGTKTITLTNATYPCGFEPNWSSDGKQLAAFLCSADGKDGIYVIDVTCLRQDQECVPNYTFVTGPGSMPTWSSDGKQLAFLTTKRELAIVSLEAFRDTKIISPKDMVCYGVDWSPVDSEIAVSCAVYKGINIFLVNSDGSHFRNITNSQSGDLYPVWSPDGNKIAFISDRFGSRPIIYHGISSNAVYIMNKDGSNIKRLSPYDNESIQWIDWVGP